MHIFIDKSTDAKQEEVKNKLSYIDDVPLFSIVEFNIMGACTRSCFFCPVSDKDFYKKINVKGLMKIDFYKKVLSDLKAINYQGKIIYSGFSEPLLHPKISELILLTKSTLNNVNIEIITNGDKLNTKKLNSMFDSGLDILKVSMYDGSHQIEKFNNMIKQTNIDKSKIILRRRYYENGNYGITVSNRGGLVNSNEIRDNNEENIINLPLKKPCYYPFYMIKIDFNGDMLMCSHDWQKKFVIGNINNDSVWDLWCSDRLNSFKKELYNSNRYMEPCSKCDVYGTLIGKDSFDVWKDKDE